MRGDRPASDRFFFLDVLERRASFRDRLPLLWLDDLPAVPLPQAEAAPDAAAGADEASGADPWALARDWARRGRRERAVEAAVRAAQHSLRDDRPGDAVQRFGYALRQLERHDPRRAALLRRQGETLAATGRHHAAARRYAAALGAAETRDQRAELLALRAAALGAAGDFDRSRRAAEQALGLDAGPAARSRAKLALGVAQARAGRLEAARQALAGVVPEGVRGGGADPALVAECRQAQGLLELRCERPEAAADLLRAAVEEFRAAGRELRGLRAAAGLVVLDALAGRLDRAERALAGLRERAAPAGRHGLIEATLSKLATLCIRRDRLDRALALSRAALEQALATGDGRLVLADRCRLADALVRCGRSGQAVTLLRTALTEPAGAVNDALADFTRVLLAGALLEAPAGHDGTVRRLLERGMSGLRQRREDWACLVGLVVEMEGLARPGSADPLDPVAAEFQARRARTDPDPELLVRAGLARAGAMLHRGNPEDAAAEARAAAEIAARAERRLDEAAAQTWLWKALTQSGAHEEAARASRRAHSLLEAAGTRIEDESVRRDATDRPVFRNLRRPAAVSPGADSRLLALYEMIRALNSETDPDALLESILDMALRVVRAERGMILLRQGSQEEFSVKLVRNLEQETAADAEHYSRGIVRQAGAGESLLVLDARHDDRFRNLESVSLYGIRSLMCVPLRLRGQIIGTVYLDSRRDAALFTRADLRFLEAFADHATIALENLRRRAELEQRNRRLQTLAHTRVRFGNLVGRAPSMQRVFDLVEKVAASELPVLIRGDSGTGKELVARAIHLNGPRRRKVFLSENCAAIADSLLESELFGHVKGAFTGADRDRPGLFEQADGGTLFLDEVGEMSPAMQAKLLRVLQEREVRRVGGAERIGVDVRVLAATHRDLEAELAAGRFREDLYYRLQVLVVPLPALRDRPGDLPLLVEHLLQRIAEERGSLPPALEPEVLELLERYSWPGNVRQLENTLQRLCLLAGEGTITLGTVRADPGLQAALRPGRVAPAAVLSLERSERERIEQALHAAGGNRERAARMLGVSRATIYRKIKQLGLR